MTVTESLPVARKSPPRLGYVPALDGLRAVAITLVAVYHGVMPAHFGGAGGVDVFFVLSGFLITALLLQERDSSGTVSLRRFYLRRVARLGPPLVLMLAVVFVPIVVTMGLGTAAKGSGLSLAYLMPIGAESGSTTLSPYEHTWSLGVEEWFYFLWPPALVWFLRWRGRAAALAVSLAAVVLLASGAVLAEAVTGEVSFVLRAGGLMAGCALAIALHRSAATARWWCVPLGLALLAFSVFRSSIAPFSTGDVFTAVAATLLLVFGIMRGPEGVLRRALSRGPIAYVGRISYEIYLWHYPVLCILGVINRSDWLEVGWIALPVSFALAAAAHRFTQPLAARLRSRIAG
ncbi:MAG: acyltransferase [Sinomonas sp.]|nr:acyltransferase [Sinomonas sp.]